MQLDGLHQKDSALGVDYVPKWRATADEDGHYSLAIPL
jgi:hypothetical protein